MRRSGRLAVIAFGSVLMSAAMSRAQVPTGQAGTAANPAASAAPPMLLWPEGAPGALGTADEDKPSLAAYLPASNPTKTAVVIAPGGGYQHLSMVREGSDVAAWLNARGVAAFVLKYRIGMKYHSPIEMEDAQRAIRMVRAQAV